MAVVVVRFAAAAVVVENPAPLLVRLAHLAGIEEDNVVAGPIVPGVEAAGSARVDDIEDRADTKDPTEAAVARSLEGTAVQDTSDTLHLGGA